MPPYAGVLGRTRFESETDRDRIIRISHKLGRHARNMSEVLKSTSAKGPLRNHSSKDAQDL